MTADGVPVENHGRKYRNTEIPPFDGAKKVKN